MELGEIAAAPNCFTLVIKTNKILKLQLSSQISVSANDFFYFKRQKKFFNDRK